LSLPDVGNSISMVRRFWEKPPRPVAQDLFERGCLWNMFVMIGGIGAFRRLLLSSVPDMVSTFELLEGYPAVLGSSVDDIYSGLQPVDFSTVVLSRHTPMLAVLRVPQIGWTDLGQPSRVRSLLRSHGHASAIGVAS
jgi:mannose-1-phosphate guanylyltransferase